MMEINISKFAGGNLRLAEKWMTVIQRSKSLQLEAIWKAQQTKTGSLTTGGGREGKKKKNQKKMHNIQMSNVKLKMTR